MITPLTFRRRTLLVGSCLALGWGSLTLGGCNFLHNYGSGTHLDEVRDKPKNPRGAKASTMQAEVVTDAFGQVTSIHFLRSSGSSAVDNYVADSIRTGWPGGPLTRSVVEISYNPGTGFTNPKIISSSPAS